MNRRSVAGIGVAVVLAGLGATGARLVGQLGQEQCRGSQAQTAVVIVDKHVPKGADAATIMTATHEGTVQQKDLAPGALTSEDQIGSQVALADLLPGDQLVKDRLASNVDEAADRNHRRRRQARRRARRWRSGQGRRHAWTCTSRTSRTVSHGAGTRPSRRCRSPTS